MKTNNWVLLFFALAFFTSCQNKKTLFRLVSSKESGIDFANNIVENDFVNPIDITNVYNGGGVAIGDVNNDGLQDIYFSSNMIDDKLYLNKGNLQFILSSHFDNFPKNFEKK